MAHEPYCNCCGCSQIEILRIGHCSALETGDPLLDYPTSFPATVTVVSPWSELADWEGFEGNWKISGGEVVLDLFASQATVSARYKPLAARETGSEFVYEAGSPPTGPELLNTLAVSLYGDIAGTLTAQLESRPLQEGSQDIWIIGYSEEVSFNSGTGWPGFLEPSNYVWGYREGLTYANRSPYTSFFSVTLQGAIVDNVDYGSDANPYAGDPQPYLVSAFYDLPEPVGVVNGHSLPANPGTPLADFKDRELPGIESVVSFTEDVSISWFVYDSEIPTASGFDLKLSLSLDANERQVILATRVVQNSTSSSGLATSVGCVAHGNPEDEATQGFFTAWVDRGARIVGVPQIGSFTGVINYPGPQYSTVTIYRNGEQVFSGNNPTAQQIKDATAPDGVYLTVTEADERSTPAWTESLPDARRRHPVMLKDFSSTVVDSVKPVLGFTPPNDTYGDSFLQFRPLYGRLLATEPVFPLGYLQVNGDMADEDPTSVLTRATKQSFEFFKADGSQIGIGTHAIRLFNQNFYSDIAGNYPLSVPTVAYTVHSPPAGAWGLFDSEYGHWGAAPTLEDPGLQTREYWRPRLDTEPVSSLMLTFSRKVTPSQVVASQLTLTKDGTVVTGCTLEPADDSGRKWRVTIPTAEQTPRSFWILTYSPSGQVYTDDIAVERFERREDFPTVGKYKTVYIHKDEAGNDVRFAYTRNIFAQTGQPYTQLEGDDPPIDPFGKQYEPEPCVLAARAGWLMADMNGYPRAIDTGYTTGAHQIGRVVSVSSVMDFDQGDKNTSIATTEGMYLTPPLGSFSPILSHKGYTPNVPTLTSPPDDCSYFGLTTTIDPCPPADVPLCLSPKIAQKHASAIRCDGDIESFEITLVSLDGSGNPQDLSDAKYGNFNTNPARSGPVDFSVALSDPRQGTDAAAFLMGKSGQKYTFEKTLDGETLSQNVWACVDGARDAELPVQNVATRQPDGICEEWDESLYSVGIKFGPITYSQEDVVDWDLNPNFPLQGENKVVLRDGEDTVVEKFMPGDLQRNSGLCIAWWADRLNPITREDCEFQRGYGSGIVRKLTAGSLSQAGLQGALSAYRAHKTFPALKTTTLGELCFSISIRMTITAEIEYEDRQLAGKYYTRATNYTEAPFDKCGNHTFDETARTFTLLWYAEDGSWTGGGGPPCNVESFVALGALTEWSSWDEGEEVGTRTVTSTFLANVNDSFALSKEKEEALASGEDVFVSAGVQGYPGNWYWKIKKVSAT